MRVCVFCGVRPGPAAPYRDAARELGRALAAKGIGLVYGGARVGLMGEVADGALGEVIGVMPRYLQEYDIRHDGLSQLHIVDGMHERKAMMADLSDAFVALPGGIGTLEEFFEAWTWLRQGLHSKPCALLNVLGFYDGLLGYVDRAIADGFMGPGSLDNLILATDAGELVDALVAS
ncbi:LOG family protein [Kutzneria chonburiensis]|uniref:Cytokinin riboside 5'-monophosphate phosphoribohydrolase n=1 Tax=Kutzneria chonburiensis TaxID=1483604 RepID=A0ABV6MXP9_9PSEU|nr:TIGR00730 family Rossman fold protein [Kutzneria chonburiensis]